MDSRDRGGRSRVLACYVVRSPQCGQIHDRFVVQPGRHEGWRGSDWRRNGTVGTPGLAFSIHQFYGVSCRRLCGRKDDQYLRRTERRGGLHPRHAARLPRADDLVDNLFRCRRSVFGFQFRESRHVFGQWSILLRGRNLGWITGGHAGRASASDSRTYPELSFPIPGGYSQIQALPFRGPVTPLSSLHG